MTPRRWTQHRTRAVPADVAWEARKEDLKRDVVTSIKAAAKRDDDRSQKYARIRAQFYDRQMRAHALTLQTSTHTDALV
jgi:L-fucose mutarotase/ribose pyranase (RbsD/FucU family)